MKIAFDARFISPEKTGVGNCAEALMCQLQRLGRKHMWDCVRSHIDTTSHPWADLWLEFYLPRYLNRTGADLFFTPAFFLPRRTSGTKLVSMIHDVAVYRHPESFPLKFTLYFRRVIRQAVERADHIVVNSEFTRTELLDAFTFLDEASLTVIPEGPAFWTRPHMNGHARPADGAGQAAHAPQTTSSENGRYSGNGKPVLPFPYLLHIGTLEPRKNVYRLLNAFRRWSRQHPELRLVLAGKGGWYGEQIQQHIRGFEDRVCLLGYVSDATLGRLLLGSSGLVFPSLYEGFGLPVLEGVIADVPMALSDIAPFREIDGGTSITFDPMSEAEIEGALEELYKRGREGGWQHPQKETILKKYCWERAAQILLNQFESMHDRRGCLR